MIVLKSTPRKAVKENNVYIYSISDVVLSGNILDGTNGDIAVDEYHRYQVLLHHFSIRFFFFSFFRFGHDIIYKYYINMGINSLLESYTSEFF